MNAINNSRARVCIPICVRRADDLNAALKRAAAHADLYELRLDCLETDEQLDAALRLLPTVLRTQARPFIFTFRPAEQGGHRALDARARLDFWTRRLLPILEKAPKSGDSDHPSSGLDRLAFDADLCADSPLAATTPHFVDLELDLVEDPTRLAAVAPLRRLATLIVSRHDFAGTPADLESIYERARRIPGAIPKLAVRAQDITDSLPVLRLLARACREGHNVIAVAMGEAGLLTRVLASSRGAFLTYASLDATHATAPGQPTARELRELYRLDSLSERTICTGLVGSPVAHSLSPQMHNAAFAARRIDGVYLPLETRDAVAFARRMAHPRTRELDWNLRGFSVTAPHKSTIIEALDEIDGAAREIGAVNTVVCVGDTLRGYNTDAAAALAPLKELIDLRGARIAVIGAGGAARAVLWSLREAGASTSVFARDSERARAVARQFGALARPLAGARFDGFDVVINATPLGTRGAREDETVADARGLRGARLVYDLVYNPAETRLLREARAAGCETVVGGGLSMLIAQAATQFELWTGASVPVEAMRAAAEQALVAE